MINRIDECWNTTLCKGALDIEANLFMNFEISGCAFVQVESIIKVPIIKVSIAFLDVLVADTH